MNRAMGQSGHGDGGNRVAETRAGRLFFGVCRIRWDIMTTLFFFLGLVALVGGAELLVRGASRLAMSLGITPLVVGLTVVAFGTSAPELAVSVQSAWSGQVDIALGNVVGSNLFNMLGVGGLVAAVAPVPIDPQILAFDLWVMLAATLVLLDAMHDVLRGVPGRLQPVAFL